MFDVGFSELILLAIVALVVLGPEKLPHAVLLNTPLIAILFVKVKCIPLKN